jgi:UDP-N-acetylmuramate dehydrogenase
MIIGSAPLLENIPLREKNSFVIGGCARYYYVPQCITDIQDIVQWTHHNSLPLFILGNGTNILISDAGWPGVVIHLSELHKKNNVEFDGDFAKVPASLPLNTLTLETVERGYSGIEELAGIPGTVGGAVIMNAGAFSQCIGDTIISVQCCDAITGKIKEYTVSELSLGYRSSRLKDSGEIILSARFHFKKSGNAEQLRTARKNIIKKRKSKQPLDFSNCGSVFKRPSGNFAGTLIEQCGLKGMQCGEAVVSQKHANFIINRGEAKAKDVRHLIVSIQKIVYERFSVLLEPEVIFIGEFDEPLFQPHEETR